MCVPCSVCDIVCVCDVDRDYALFDSDIEVNTQKYQRTSTVIHYEPAVEPAVSVITSLHVIERTFYS